MCWPPPSTSRCIRKPEGGTNTAPGNYSERIIRENFFVPFKAAVQEAHVGSIMASYNEIDGVPSHMNHWLLDRVLRQEWGFNGYIISDGDGLQMLVRHPSRGLQQCRRCAPGHLPPAWTTTSPTARSTARWSAQVKQGIVPESEVDRAVAHILATKFRLGLFDTPYVDPDYAERTTNSEEHRQIALQAARKALVLLKNDKNLLPLDVGKLKTIAVIGPNAADVHLGGYSRDPGQGGAAPGRLRRPMPVMPYLARVPNPMLRAELANRLAERLRMDERLLREELRRAAGAARAEMHIQPESAAPKATTAEKELLKHYGEHGELR